MMQAKPEKISIGAPLVQNPVARSGIETPEGDVNGYRVRDMPKGLEAQILRTKAYVNRWSFSVFKGGGGEITLPQGRFDSKELALEGLEKWLLANAADYKLAAPKAE
jgi:hypothetical protein